MSTNEEGKQGGSIHENWVRSLAKTASYRVTVSAINLVVFYLLTGQVTAAVGFTALNLVYTTIIYFIHERAWARIRWGEPGSP
ncbi:MAG TPA: DUF2061 domain-containing protein [Methanomicrobiales archaeon]|nr:DUF2061 domain-containing protein [Methanomicrobiales archaeon]